MAKKDVNTTVIIIGLILALVLIFKFQFFGAVIEICENNEPFSYQGFIDLNHTINYNLTNYAFTYGDNSSEIYVADQLIIDKLNYIFIQTNQLYPQTCHNLIDKIVTWDEYSVDYMRINGKQVTHTSHITHADRYYFCNDHIEDMLFITFSSDAIAYYGSLFFNCTVTDEDKEACINSGGTWNYGTCTCPENYTLYQSACIEDLSSVCAKYNGTWTNGLCACPDGYGWENNICEKDPPSSGGGGGSGSGQTTTTTTSATTTTLEDSKKWEFTIGDYTVAFGLPTLLIVTAVIGGAVYYLYFFKDGPRLGKKKRKRRKRR